MFCLTPNATELLKNKLVDDKISPKDLSEMDSEQRHGYFASFLGEPAATKLNEVIESKLLLKNQQQGLINGLKQVFGEKHPAMRDAVSKVMRMEKLLKPEDEDKFLADLAAHKLGSTVTMDETAKIYDKAKLASDSKSILEKDPLNKEKIIHYGRKYLDLVDYADSLKPKSNPFASFSNWWNLPKSALTSVLHFSAPGVQGWGMATTGRFWQAFGKMFSYFGNPLGESESFKDLNAYIVGHPDYKFAVDGKLGLTKLGDKLNSREEAIQSSILEHVPALGKVVKASNRAFAGFLNDLRFNRFTDLLNAARLHGEDVSIGSKVVKDIANTVNDFTGRGQLGENDKYASAQVIANNIFFAPRKLAATVNMFNPIRYLDPSVSPTARNAAIRQLTGSLIATYSMLQLAQMAGAKVNLDPRSQDFAKIKFGKTDFGITGGNAIYIRLLAQLATNTKITSGGKTRTLGKGYDAETRADVAISFMRNKLSPTASFLADALYGKDPVGDKFSLKKEAYNKLIPIFTKSFIDMVRNDPNNGMAYVGSLAAGLGVEMHTKEPKER